tara:strand:+ start:742 stop:1161 length:420 start_codon:yes stop_codon:yes gene_type:complete
MSVAVWPTDLPFFLRDTYGQQRQDARLRKASGGPPGYRRRFSSTARFVTLGLELTRARKAVFDDFYDETTKGGTRPFLMPDPTTDGVLLLDAQYLPMLTESGEAIRLDAKWLCMFSEPVPDERMIGGRYDITFTVSVLP